jgi:hypothetical protein
MVLRRLGANKSFSVFTPGRFENINEPLLLPLTKRQQNQKVMVNPLLSAMVYFP